MKRQIIGYAWLFCLNTTLCITFFLLPTGKPKLFFVSVKGLQGLGKLNVLVQTADTLIQVKKPDNINPQIRLLHGTHTYYRNLGQILRLNCAGTKLLSANVKSNPPNL